MGKEEHTIRFKKFWDSPQMSEDNHENLYQDSRRAPLKTKSAPVSLS